MEFKRRPKVVGLMLFGIIIIIIIIAWKNLKISSNIYNDSTTDVEKSKREDKKDDYLLVLFTTFKENSPHHVFAHSVAVPNWASLGRAVKPVLFADLRQGGSPTGVDLTRMARHHGWDVLAVPATSEYGTPHLKPMFTAIFRRYKASFYGYANGDLLFDEGLLKSLTYVNSISNEHLNNNVLMIGRRTDVILNIPQGVLYSANPTIQNAFIDESRTRFNASNLHKMASRSGSLRSPNTIDYFIFTKRGSTFNWTNIAEVVIGRRAYDQYLVVKAMQFGVQVIDLSGTVEVVHLSKPGVLDTGLENVDKEYNRELVGRRFPHVLGTTASCALFLVEGAISGDIVLARRKPEIENEFL